MLVILPILGKPIFAGGDVKGILTPLILNLIWRAFTGALTPSIRSRRPPLAV